ncbi:CLUMA_CG001807, isoform A [Clunio marinus]|uniref:CLUMA_CG001807, isoform A n=1 Tax=Clunio marinus TaxID=568069 RepID=A0A1J1HJ33_9DIPT|nr:CLUMA_CG001807, isoform A [Clunio marinus]
MKILVVFLVFWINFAQSAQRSARKFYPLKWDNCPMKNLPAKAYMNAPESFNKEMNVSGTLDVSEEIAGDIVFILETNKCTLNMKTCEKFTTLNIRDFCDRFTDKNQFFYEALASVQPEFKCPIKAGNYTMFPTIVDLSVTNMFPLDGYVWVASFKFISITNKGKTKKIVFCMNIEIKVVREKI